MTKQQFIAEFRSEIDGWILDSAMENRTGAALSIHLRQMRAKIEAKLGEMWETMQKAAEKTQTTVPMRKAQ